MAFPIELKQYPQLQAYTFSILIPSWNNLAYLQNCIQAIQQHSHFQHQIIVVANEATDGTLAYLQEAKIDHVHAPQNLGICYALNACRPLIKSQFVMYMNDDMYVLPNWDLPLQEAIQQIGHSNFMLSATLIEPFDTGNQCVVVKPYGDDLKNFKKDQLLQEYKQLERNDWCGSSWPPSLVSLNLWDLVGAYSVEFSPGMYSDPDFSKKLYDAGVRVFMGVGKSLVYHFGSKSTRNLSAKRGRNLFVQKWGISAGFFYKKYLHMGSPFHTLPPSYQASFFETIKNKIKRSFIF